MRENMEIIKTNLERAGINTKEDIITLVRSQSTKDRFNPTSMTIDSQRFKTDKKLSNTNRTVKSQSSKR
jgi:hypothetical protein